jgi:hypothetical protein
LVPWCCGSSLSAKACSNPEALARLPADSKPEALRLDDGDLATYLGKVRLAALTYVPSNAERLGVDPDFLTSQDLLRPKVAARGREWVTARSVGLLTTSTC